MGYGSQGPQTDTYGPTNALWQSIILDKCLSGHDRYYGVGMFDDFLGFAGLVATHDGAYFSQGNRYLSYEESSNPVSRVASTQTAMGVIALTTAASDDTCAMAWGGSLVTPYVAPPFSVIPGTSKDLVFECRFKVNTITAAQFNFFIGLAGATGVKSVDADVPITGSDAFVTTLSLLGFGRLTAGTTALNLYYERANGTVASKASVGTLAADTYLKAGFKWDGTANTLTPWINGVEIGASRVLAAVTAATPWPNDYIGPVAAIEGIASAAGYLTMDWWGCCQRL